MAKNNNQKVNNLFAEMDKKETEARILRQKAHDCDLAKRKNKENIYNAIHDALPKRSENAVLARDVVASLTNDNGIEMRLMGMLTGKAQSDSFFSSSYDHIMKHKKTFCTYSIECDENGNPIPNAIPIKRKRERNVYWYK